MTAEELKITLDRIGITLRDLSLIAGVTERQARYWRNGESPVPQLVELVLIAMSGGDISIGFVTDFVERKMREKV